MRSKPLNTLTTIASCGLVVLIAGAFSKLNVLPSTALHLLNTTQVKIQIVEPILTVKSEPPQDSNRYDSPNPSQNAIAANNVIFYKRNANLVALEALTKKTLWTTPAPWLFTAHDDLLFTSTRYGQLKAFNSRTRTALWDFKATGTTPPDSSLEPRILTVVGDILIVAGFTVSGDSYVQTTWALEPRNGRVIWTGTPFFEKREFNVEFERYMVLPVAFFDPPSTTAVPPQILDVRNGRIYEWHGDPAISDGVLNQTHSGKEFVNLDYPTEPAILESSVRDSFVVNVSIWTTDGNLSRTQDLGTFNLTPPLECLGDTVFNVGGVDFWSLGGRSVGFIGANESKVWLVVRNDCNFRVVKISRGLLKQVSIIDLPEKLCLPQRLLLKKQGKLPDAYPQARLSLEQRIEFLGEGRAVAQIRSAPDAKDLLWFKLEKTRLYTLYRSKELRVFDTQTGALLQRLKLALPESTDSWIYAQFNQNAALLNGRIFTWIRSTYKSDLFSRFFVLPN
jgi:outer membrane protein assembly factor BamB